MPMMYKIDLDARTETGEDGKVRQLDDEEVLGFEGERSDRVFDVLAATPEENEQYHLNIGNSLPLMPAEKIQVKSIEPKSKPKETKSIARQEKPAQSTPTEKTPTKPTRSRSKPKEPNLIAHELKKSAKLRDKYILIEIFFFLGVLGYIALIPTFFLVSSPLKQIIGFILAIGFIVIVIKETIKDKEEKAELFTKIHSRDGFSKTDAEPPIVGKNGATIVISHKAKEISLVSKSGELKVVKFDDIYACEIVKDGESFTKTSRSSQIGGAIVGGVLLGGLGAVVGGLSGKTKTKEVINKIVILITHNDPKNPIFYLELRYPDMVLARKINGFFEVIIKNTDREKAQQPVPAEKIQVKSIEPKSKPKETKSIARQEKPAQSTPTEKIPTKPTRSRSKPKEPNLIADELKKLAKLRDENILTESEFQLQKEKLMGIG